MNTTAYPAPTMSGPHVDFLTVAIIFSTLQALVFIVATLGNLLVIVAFVRHLDTSRATNKFILNLAILDLLTGVVMPYQIAGFFLPALDRHLATCLLRFQTIAFFTLSSQICIVFCTLDRYVAIVHPLQHDVVMTPRNTSIMVCIPWVYGFVVSILPFTGLNNWKKGAPCVFELVVDRSQLFISALTTLLQTTVCVVMYAMILRVARMVRNRVRPAPRSRVQKREMKSGVVMGLVTVALTVCWLPFSVTTLLQAFRFDPMVSFVGNCLVFIGIAHSIVNPFIYAWQKVEFRCACSRLLRGRPVSRTRAPTAPDVGGVRTITQQLDQSDRESDVDRMQEHQIG